MSTCLVRVRVGDRARVGVRVGDVEHRVPVDEAQPRRDALDEARVGGAREVAPLRRASRGARAGRVGRRLARLR